MNERWKIFCEESGDKCLKNKNGSTRFYVVTAVLVEDRFEDSLSSCITRYKESVFKIKRPLEWKTLPTKIKRDDKRLGRFLKKISENSPFYIISMVVCNKSETTGTYLNSRPNFLMNYLYGLLFKRLSCFLSKTNAVAELIIDRNTDADAQDSFRRYISDISKITTGQHPRHSKPHWTNPELNPALGLSDFVSGLTVRSLTEYEMTNLPICSLCETKENDCIYTCTHLNFKYKRSMKRIVALNYSEIGRWHWLGLLYHPYECKDNHCNIFQPQ